MITQLSFMSQTDLQEVKETLENIQEDLFNNAKKFLNSNIVEAKNWNEFVRQIKNKKLVNIFFCGNVKCEEDIKNKTDGVTSRLIPFEQPKNIGKCVHCNKDGKFLVIFGKAY